MPLFIIFIVVPMLEIAVLVEVGKVIGTVPTLSLIVLTAMVGTQLIRLQGRQVAEEFKQSIQYGQIPMGPVFSGMCLLVSGAFLLTPGYVTDIVGFSLLVPKFREFLRQQFKNRLTTRAKFYEHPAEPHMDNGKATHPHNSNSKDAPVIEGDFSNPDDDNNNL